MKEPADPTDGGGPPAAWRSGSGSAQGLVPLGGALGGIAGPTSPCRDRRRWCSRPVALGSTASGATHPRTIDVLTKDVTPALAAIDSARAAPRARAWELAGAYALDHGST